MKDVYLRYGFYVRGHHRVLTARQMRSRKVIRWIKNEAARRAAQDGITFSTWAAYLDDYVRDAPIIFIRKRSRDGKWVEAPLPTYRVFSCDPHWFEDFCTEVPGKRLPRLPRKEAKTRVWLLGTLLRAMKNEEARSESKR